MNSTKFNIFKFDFNNNKINYYLRNEKYGSTLPVLWGKGQG